MLTTTKWSDCSSSACYRHDTPTERRIERWSTVRFPPQPAYLHERHIPDVVFSELLWTNGFLFWSWSRWVYICSAVLDSSSMSFWRRVIEIWSLTEMNSNTFTTMSSRTSGFYHLASDIFVWPMTVLIMCPKFYVSLCACVCFREAREPNFGSVLYALKHADKITRGDTIYFSPKVCTLWHSTLKLTSFSGLRGKSPLALVK